MFKIYKINAKNFRPFGWVIEYPVKARQRKQGNLFRKIILEPKKVGWRIAYLVVSERQINKLEQHTQTFETFEPACGESLLYLADKRQASSIKCFYLDKPVVLKKGIWHGVISLNGKSEIKITENAKVKSCFWALDFVLNKSGKILL